MYCKDSADEVADKLGHLSYEEPTEDACAFTVCRILTIHDTDFWLGEGRPSPSFSTHPSFNFMGTLNPYSPYPSVETFCVLPKARSPCGPALHKHTPLP